METLARITDVTGDIRTILEARGRKRRSEPVREVLDLVGDHWDNGDPILDGPTRVYGPGRSKRASLLRSRTTNLHR